MNNFAIQTEHLSKRYEIGALRRPTNSTLQEVILDTLRRPFMGSRRSHAEAARTTLWALKDVSLDVQHGEVVGIIGRNGAGKSTLLKILSRITEPSSGTATIHGRVASLLEVGTGFHPELTGRENIFLNGAILGMSRMDIARRFDEIVAFAEIEQFLDTPVKHYSSGMYVRLAFAVAAHLEPEVLFVDEVLAVGDARFQMKCLGRMGDAAREGRTIIFVSHNLAAIAQLCQRAIWLDQGSIRTQGPPQQVLQEYLSEGSNQQSGFRIMRVEDGIGDNRVRLMAAHVIQDGEPTAVIDINRPCSVEIEFELLQDARNLISGVSLYTFSDLCLFNCCDWRPNQLPRGRYTKRMEIPAHTLADGRFRVLVQLVFYDPDIPSVVMPDALTVDAVDSEHPGAVRGHYKGDWPGVMRLGLPWSEAEQVMARPG
ncbi:MAG: ABC transporter ATP-binding protein [Chloroflexota bacterium]